jgi:hypothetical protein
MMIARYINGTFDKRILVNRNIWFCQGLLAWQSHKEVVN